METKKENFSLTSPVILYYKYTAIDHMFQLVHIKPSSGLAHTNTCSNFKFHTFCVLNTEISSFATCAKDGLLRCDVIMNS